MAIFIVSLFTINVTAGGKDENYNDHSYEGSSPNAKGNLKNPDQNVGLQKRDEPRTRNKDA